MQKMTVTKFNISIKAENRKAKQVLPGRGEDIRKGNQRVNMVELLCKT
jgi:hypothetical protein